MRNPVCKLARKRDRNDLKDLNTYIEHKNAECAALKGCVEKLKTQLETLQIESQATIRRANESAARAYAEGLQKGLQL